MIKEKRYQELGRPYRIFLWIRWMPLGYIKGLGWYFIKRLRWENVCDDECGRIKLDTCIGICIGTVQCNMRWYYTLEEVLDDNLIVDDDNFVERVFNFVGKKVIKIVDGERYFEI